MDYLAAMRVFVRVVERGSMSAAARDLGIGQPAVSERIERLEAQLGARLLRRNTRSISLTDAGAGFYERSKAAIEAADEALREVRKDLPLRGSVRIAAPHGLGETVLPALLLRLRRECPQLRIDLVLNDRVVDPVTEGVDVSLRLGGPGEGHFVARKLGHVRRVLVASPDYLERHGEPATPDDLVRHPFARVSGLFNNGRLTLRTAQRRTVAAVIDTVLSVSHGRPLHALLLGGAAIGVLQEPVCREDLAAGRLRRVLPEFAVPGFDLHVLYGADKPAPQRIKTVVALLQKELPALV
ncbi:LysR family transcriptional regulator [Lysobacter sp. K5869]|uniref:LysR family transcriptional regulator n=1 Tax=Lysobacter sp. K5869 TaxID=2820808 RepID=UPI001C062EE5|nr:LysR family transcriptional regulator [Lysobacter sp. K5869]QWP75218.1 LysR family transcriptional regulator [Lysobacter sp. K5869]